MSLSHDRRRAIEHALLALVPGLVTAYVLYRTYADGNAAVDFRHSFWIAGWRTLHGFDPYRWTRAQTAAGASFPYPAPAAVLFALWALLPSFSAGIIATAACVLAVPAALRILDVRDWRIYGAAALWSPVIVGWQTANLTLPILVGLALLWRWRGRPWAVATLVAGLICLKPILAPLWLWLVVTGRHRAAGSALVMGIVLNTVAWSILGWRELGAWWRLLHRQGGLRDATGYSLTALTTHLGLERAAGVVLILLCGLLLTAIAARAHGPAREVRALSAAVLLTIVISPQIDLHYLALLAVPLALTDRRLGWAWLAPLVLWPCPATAAATWQIVLWWAVLTALAVRILTAQRAGTPGRTQPAGPVSRV
ncbi:MAG TPA: glycosyltransferase family 87 protein [Solirubrobacteraceae bacterium]|nr:glycosyltransferase family 87 protein [Solirubrobacteraceae bacterium]